MGDTIGELLTGNAKFVSGEFLPNEESNQAIATKQTLQVLWIGCSDSRVSAHQMTGSKPGTMFVHRNVANIVAFNDVNISAILEYGVVHLKIQDITRRAAGKKSKAARRRGSTAARGTGVMTSGVMPP